MSDYANAYASYRVELDVIDPSITCTDCGACCLHMGYPPFISIDGEDEDWDALTGEMQEEIRDAQFDNRGDRELPCIWFDFDKRQCKHYDLRPDICEAFPVGGEGCLRHRETRGIAS